jgi:hypothetical protein
MKISVTFAADIRNVDVPNEQSRNANHHIENSVVASNKTRELTITEELTRKQPRLVLWYVVNKP